ncbi:MAG: acyltransferase family protein [Pleurocapsa sp.]
MKWQILAGWRFILAFIVICFHLQFFISDWSDSLVAKVASFSGLAAVIGFLIISGYSIAKSISRKPENFYRRRILRIYPLYVCSIAVSLLPFFLMGSEVVTANRTWITPEAKIIAGNLLFLQGFAVKYIEANLALWILSIQIVCYILAPFLIKLNQKVLISLTTASAILYAGYPHLYSFVFTTTDIPFPNQWIYGIPLALFLWAWLLGLLYGLNENNKLYKLVLVSLGCLVLMINPTYVGIKGIFIYLVTSVILVADSFIKLPKKVISVANYLGEISYPLYLFHIPAFIFANAVLGIKNSFSLILMALLVSITFYHTVDVPFRQKKIKRSLD